MHSNVQLLYLLLLFNNQPSFTVKNPRLQLVKNRSRDFGLSVTNRQDRAVMNVNLCFLI